MLSFHCRQSLRKWTVPGLVLYTLSDSGFVLFVCLFVVCLLFVCLFVYKKLSFYKFFDDLLGHYTNHCQFIVDLMMLVYIFHGIYQIKPLPFSVLSILPTRLVRLYKALNDKTWDYFILFFSFSKAVQIHSIVQWVWFLSFGFLLILSCLTKQDKKNQSDT